MWRAWNDLHSSRAFVSLGMAGAAPQPIKPSEIKAWLDLEEIGSEERREIVELVRGLDLVFMRWVGERRRG